MSWIPFLRIFWLFLSLGFLLWVSFWLVVPALTGLPWVPSRLERVEKALRMADLQRDELLVDLGSGDGRVLLLAARVFGARGRGVEISPLLAAWTNWQARRRGLTGRVHASTGNFYHADLQDADVVYLYATARQVQRLAADLPQRLSAGTRLVCVSAPVEGWKPIAADTHALIFVYAMPPQPGGLEAWLLDNVPGGPPAVCELPASEEPPA